MYPGKRYTPNDVMQAFRRRFWWMVLPAAVVAIAGVVVVKQLPATYQSDIVMQVLPGKLPDSYLSSGGSSRGEDQIVSLRQFLTRNTLHQIIQDLDLYRTARATEPMDDVIDDMRGDITLQQADKEVIKVSYKARDPRTAQAVAERIATLFLDENARAREGQAEAAQALFQSQLDDAGRQLAEQDKKLEQYRSLHAGELPTQVASNVQMVGSLQAQMQLSSESLNKDRDQRLYLTRQRDAVVAETPAPAPVTPPGVPAAQASASEQLDSARATLHDMQLRLTDAHPDIQAQKDLITKLEAQAAQERRGGQRVATPSELARQARLRDFDAQIELLDRQIASKLAEQRRMAGTIADYRARADAAPRRESELSALTRDYDTLKKRYETLLSKKEDARLSASVERSGIASRFRLLETPMLPETPVSPNRRMLGLAVLALAGLVGLAVGALVEYRDSSLRTDDDVVAALKLPVLAMIPVMTPEE